MAWRIANSLVVLRDQVNAAAPKRSKISDGTIGDPAHRARKSDHNPNSAGVVTAIDFTHDPKGGFDAYTFADILKANRDPRVKYVISNRRIWNPSISDAWRAYTGANPHDKHTHVSVQASKGLYDDDRPWDLGAAPTVPPEEPAMPTPKFERCHAVTAKWEGGYSNHPSDPGGATNYGVTQATYDAYRRDKGQAKQAVSKITKAEALDIFFTRYWTPVRGEEMPSGVDLALYDFGVNSGPARAIKALQKVVGVAQDGKIGPITMKAVSAAAPATLASRLCDERMAYLKRLKTWSTFGKGWTNRVNDVRAKAVAWAGSPIPPDVPAETPSAPKVDPKDGAAIGVGVGAGGAAAAAGFDWWLVLLIAVIGLVAALIITRAWKG